MESEPAAAPARSFGAVLGDMYFAPGDAFTELAARPSFAPAMLGFIGVQVAFLALWFSRMDFVQFLRAQAEAGGRPAPPASAISESAITGIKWVIATTGVAASILFLAILAGVLLFVFNFVLGAATTFRHALTVVCWVAFATSLVTTPLLVTVMALRAEWSVPPDQVIQASLAAFLERASVGKFAYSLAQSVDVFVAWMLVLTSIGMGRATRRPAGSAAVAIVSVWLVFVLGKATLAAAFG